MSHANRGKIWENQLTRYHHLIRGRALITRNHPEVVVLRDRRTGKVKGARHHAPGAPDYTILSEGLTIVADAKSTQKPRWALNLLKAHQAETLDRVEVHGGLSLLLINTPDGSYAVPWLLVLPLWVQWSRGGAGYGESSLTPAQMRDMSLCWEKKGTMIDYLGPALHHLKTRGSP